MSATAAPPFDAKQVAERLRSADFKALFVNELGWEHAKTSHSVTVDDREYTLAAAAHKRGFQALVLHETGPGAGNGIPPYAVRKKIEKQIAAQVFEHIIIYLSADKSEQIWQWVRRAPGRPDAAREVRYHKGQSGDGLVSKLRTLTYGIDDDPALPDVAEQTRLSFDVAPVTKRFYEQFKKEHDAFLKFLKGIPTTELQEWYTSVLLNRLMFIYFLQSKGFLDGDRDYLAHKLAQSMQGGVDRFYRLLLCPLFFEGFARAKEDRSPATTALLGDIPYLNGGLFAQHQIEQAHGREIAIPDQAFARIFAFFDGWEWVLDDRPTRTGSEINPDVLGYIFEKYINQKQMGAYYTKEDITEYICRNTIVPHLLDRARADNLLAFDAGPDVDALLGRAHPHPERTVWRHLREDPDRYIFAAVKKGVELPLPPDIAAGMDDVSKRGGWNRPADAAYALPTEIWRETVARRQRYAEVRKTLADGKVKSSNQLITLNLDLRQFARDLIDQCGERTEDVQLLRSFWSALSTISVLDPTCGSGAFLFAALNVLEDLYDAALDRMEWLTARAPEAAALADLRATLAEVDKHPNRRYFILKRIIVDTLYGVDIMEEAVEIAKLRLFLKLVAQLEPGQRVEPLPDIDFNIRAGNTLVGFVAREDVRRALYHESVVADTEYVQDKMVFGEESALESIDRRAGEVDRAFAQFRWAQTHIETSAQEMERSKQALQGGLAALRNELDLLLAREYGVVRDRPKGREGRDWEAQQAAALDRWRKSHEPFHWFIEFYGVMKQGGFDVIVGNPPYVEYSKVRSDYSVVGYSTQDANNLYAFVFERSLDFLSKDGAIGLIVPISSFGTSRMESLQRECRRQLNHMWISSFGIRPSKLFEGAEQRLSICVGYRSEVNEPTMHTTKYMRWYSDERDGLLSLLSYQEVSAFVKVFGYLKLSERIELSIVSKLPNNVLGTLFFDKGATNVYWHRIPGYYIKATDFVPFFRSSRDGVKKSEDYKVFTVRDSLQGTTVVSVLSSSLFYWFWFSGSDGYHCGKHEVLSFPFNANKLSSEASQRLSQLSARLMKDLKQNSVRRIRDQRTTKVHYDEFYPSQSKPIIDEIDRVLAKHYGFSDEELDYIINYDIKYRMGDALGDGEDE